MGFGVKESKATVGRHVPGTATLFDVDGDAAQQLSTSSSFKHGKGKNADIILVPQPSNSPNDPLNWPQWKKYLTFFSICLSVCMAGALGPLLAPEEADIAKEFGISISKAALPAGYPLLTAGLGAFLAQAWAPILGKRSAYIISTLILFVTTIWNGWASSFNSLLAARTVSGFGNGAYESIVISSIGDLFFVHERGKVIVAYNIVTLGAANICPILGGYISQQYGWRMQFRILIAFTGLALLLIIFACPEHAYVRPQAYETDMADETENPKNAEGVESNAETSTEKPRTYWDELKPFNGLISRQNLLILLARPFACFLYPAVFWGFTVGGLWSAWTIGLSVVVAQIFGGPPNLFDDTQLGFLFTFPFVFLIIGCLVGFLLSDWWPKFCARRNHGVFEPEFRLILLIPVLLVGIPGLFGFGYYAAGANDHWVAASCLQGLIAFASVLAASVSFNYVLDCHRSRSVEVSVAIIMLRNFFWFGSSYFLPDWLMVAPTSTIFSVIGAIQLGITLCSVFIYVYGKQLRWFFYQHDPVKMLGLA
ncbi:hypothetical protein VTN77DRAFT_2207 [Rasamsonia byssochlamydoides]|uniref:uncharacterized protein n=1 Tax=Rasamsonia byssochlamydoides TaxID=89139 RepID=UPI003742DD81